MARATATNTVPCTCDAAESRSPNGLHRSHNPIPGPTGAPQRAQGWVGSAAGDGVGGVGATGATGGPGAVGAPLPPGRVGFVGVTG